MLKRKQFITIVTVALISFLLGTLLSVTAVTTDDGGNPFDKIWEAIFGLEERQDQTETSLDEMGEIISEHEERLTALEEPVGLSGEITIGSLLPLTGGLATFGENSMVAIDFAAEEVNAFLEEAGAGWTLKILTEDTGTDPALALDKLESLAAVGIKFVIGPMSSGEVSYIKGYADIAEILVVSQSSTMPGLNEPDDFLFRFCPTDLMQGPAIARLIANDDVTKVIAVYRNDPWGVGVHDATKARFEELEGTFIESIPYDPWMADFSALAATVDTKVTSAIATYGADQVGVLYIGFEEASDFLMEARAYKILWNVKWYGSDGTALSGDLIENVPVAMLGAATGFINTFFGPTRSDKFDRVHDELVAVLGREPDSYAYIAYDIVWVLALSLLTVDAYDSVAVRAVLPSVTENYFGASGWIVLDENGDRAFGDYDLWQIIAVEPVGYTWELVGTYIHATDSITWLYRKQYLHLSWNSGYTFEATSEDLITLGHGWAATTEEYVEDWLGNVTLTATIDGEEIVGQWSDIYLITEGAWAGFHITEWRYYLNPGSLPAGVHHVTTVVDLAEAIFDGFDWYGPGTGNPTPWNYEFTIEVT